LFTRKRVFKHKKSFLISSFVVLASGKCELHIYFTYLQEFYRPHIRKYLKVFRIIGDALSKIHFHFSIMSKWIAKHICNKVSFKITIRKRHVYIDIRWPWKWNQYFHFGIWLDDPTKMITLPSFQLAKKLNSQNTNETMFINEHGQINLYMNIGSSDFHIWSFVPN